MNETSEISFSEWFTTLTGHDSPRQWQEALAEETICRDRLIRIPTGLGKTAGVLAAWSFHRLGQADDRWPRRLVWCLPMRVLVEQTEQVARELVARMPTLHPPKVHIVMGGEDEDVDQWYLYPENPAIIIGTQDMLLSRALNRGYASPRARWPVEFGLLNHDVLWVMDEVQLMDVGLATSAQLQAFRDQDRHKGFRPSYTWWMSATLQPEWLRSVDTAERHSDWIRNPCTVIPGQRHGGLWSIGKALAIESSSQDKAFARRILDEHAATAPSEFGRITLVICNTVERACRTFDILRAAGRTEGIELVHSRFRPVEREDWRDRFLCRAACSPESDRIIVATQVVEAGVDISAGCLITELAPWPSLVQRFGRCARYGGKGRVLVVDLGRDRATAAPYLLEELESAWESLQTRTDVGITDLEAYEESLSPERRARLYPYAPAHLLLRREFDELFDTTPDLTGADLDISRFIRSDDERDLQVFWLDVDKWETPLATRRPQRRELCAVPFLKARDWLCGEETKTNRKPRLRSEIRAWVWDWIDGTWAEATRASLLPGRVVCVAAACGGYRTDRGFDPDSRTTVPTVPPPEIPDDVRDLDEADDQQDGENLSRSAWKTIACHGSEAANVAREISDALRLPDDLRDILVLAARWHDWGKSHPAFQGVMRAVNRPLRSDLAKGPDGVWWRPEGKYWFPDDSDARSAFRHELASALGLFAILETFAPQHPALLGPWLDAFAKMGRPVEPPQPASLPTPTIQHILACSAEQFDLLVYLIASHHGKVRLALHAAPKDQDYRDRDGRGLPIRGVREGDRLPAVAIEPDTLLLPETSLTLEPASLGLSMRTGASWRERCLALVDRIGPTGLAYLESLLRAADVRASRSKTVDPALTQETSV
jgi:CRISPR-associated endonuclease/helicase Cas3